MSEAYNPETTAREQLEHLALDARRLKRKLEQTAGSEDRRVVEQQLRDVEHRLEQLKRRLR